MLLAKFRTEFKLCTFVLSTPLQVLRLVTRPQRLRLQELVKRYIHYYQKIYNYKMGLWGKKFW